MDDKFKAILGFARRAGKIVSGESAAQALINQGKAKLLILALDAAPGTKRNFHHLAEKHSIKVIEWGNKLDLGIAIGHSPRSVVVILDEGFAKSLRKIGVGESSN